MLPVAAAKCSGVECSSSKTLTLLPFSSNSFALPSELAHATCKGVAPDNIMSTQVCNIIKCETCAIRGRYISVIFKEIFCGNWVIINTCNVEGSTHIAGDNIGISAVFQQ